MRFQTGVFDDPTLRAISSSDWLASSCNSARIFRSVSSRRTAILFSLRYAETCPVGAMVKNKCPYLQGHMAQNRDIFLYCHGNRCRESHHEPQFHAEGH